MKLKFENLGVIKSGEIDLSKDMIVLTGGNNTGKSYVSYMLYGLDLKVFTDLRKNLIDLFNTFIDIKDNFPLIVTKINIHANFNALLDKLIDVLTESLKRNFYTIYASKTINPDVLFTVSKDTKNKMLKLFNSVKGNFDDVIVEYNIEVKDGIIICMSSFLKEHNKENAILLSKQYLVEAILKIYIKGLNLFGMKSGKNISLRFFPAERSSINLFSDDIVQNKAKKLDEISLMSEQEREKVKFNPNYPLAINYYLYFINSLRETAQKSEYSRIADETEKLIGGKLALNEFFEMIFKPDKSNQNLDLHISSSTVKSLAGLVFYFRYYAKKDDVIFIDEPELNLHPDNQILLTRILAKAVNNGIKMVISTHSDFIIKELNNLIMLNQDKGKIVIKKLKYDEGSILNNNKIGAYYFPSGMNTVVQELKVSKTGINVESIDKTIDRQDFNSETIYYNLFEN